MLRRSSAASGNSVIKKCLILKLTSCSLPCLLRGKMSSYDKNRATACNASATEDVENDSRECVFAMLSCNNCSNRAMIHHVFQDPKFVLRPGVSEQHLSLHLSLSFSLSLSSGSMISLRYPPNHSKYCILKIFWPFWWKFAVIWWFYTQVHLMHKKHAWIKFGFLLSFSI